jgi:hypothetical protein
VGRIVLSVAGLSPNAALALVLAFAIAFQILTGAISTPERSQK